MISATRVLIVQAWILSLCVSIAGWTRGNRDALDYIADAWVPGPGAWQ
ncbi:MAG TPA: hypothetical protein VI172_16085 [Candidatus Dormibacteraeota bacterium]|jgi:hypothetical protein